MEAQVARYALEKVLKYELTISGPPRWREREGGVMTQKAGNGAPVFKHLVDVVSDVLQLDVGLGLLLGLFFGLDLGSPDLWDGPHDLATC